MSVSTVRLIPIAPAGRFVVVNVFTDQVVSVNTVRLILVVPAGRVVVTRDVFSRSDQVVLVRTVRMKEHMPIVLAERLAAIINVITIQVVSVGPVLSITIVLKVKERVVAAVHVFPVVVTVVNVRLIPIVPAIEA